MRPFPVEWLMRLLLAMCLAASAPAHALTPADALALMAIPTPASIP